MSTLLGRCLGTALVFATGLAFAIPAQAQQLSINDVTVTEGPDARPSSRSR